MIYEAKRHHQLAIDHLLKHKRAMLFAGMGLGKTGASLLATLALQSFGEVRATLIVAPLRVTMMTWPQELRNFEQFRSFRVANLRTKEGWSKLRNRAADIYLINYEQLPKLATEYMAPNKGNLAFNHVIFDESTFAKNPSSSRINAFRKFMDGIDYRWALTGTPNPNSLLELFAQVRLIDGGRRLGKIFSAFRSEYFEPTDYMEYNWVPKPGAKERIYAAIQDITLTLLSSEFLGLPDTITEDHEIHLPTEARALYRELEKEMFAELDNEAVTVVSAAAMTTKLLQVATGQCYVDGVPGETKQWKAIHDEKMKALEKIAAEGEPLLVACSFRHEQEVILKRFPQARGLLNATDRETEELFKSWNQGRVPMLVADHRSVGHGLNLQWGGRHCVWVSLPWSPEKYHQFNSRLARPGQKDIPRVTRIVANDTIDELVLETLKQKDDGQMDLLRALRDYRDLRR